MKFRNFVFTVLFILLCGLGGCNTNNGQGWITPDIMGDAPIFLEVKSPPNPELLGQHYGKVAGFIYGYDLVEIDGKYAIFYKYEAKTRSNAAWGEGYVDGNAIYLDKIKIWVTDSGDVYKKYDGKDSQRLSRVPSM